MCPYLPPWGVGGARVCGLPLVRVLTCSDLALLKCIAFKAHLGSVLSRYLREGEVVEVGAGRGHQEDRCIFL